MGRIAFPLPPAVLHLANALANMARPLGIRAQAAGRIRVPQGFLHAQDDGLDREKPFLNANSFAEGIAALLGRGNHQPKQGRPVHRAAAREVERERIQKAQFIGGDQDEARLIEATPAGAAKHLQQFIRLDEVRRFVAAVRLGSQRDAAQGKIDARGQAHGGDHHSQLSGLGQGLDDAGPRPVAQAAVVIGDAALEQLGQVFADQELLPGAELERVGRGQLPRQLVGHCFGGLPARRKDQDRPQVFRQRLGHQPRPVAADFARNMITQAVGMDLFLRDGAPVVANQDGFPAESLQPFDHILRVVHAAAEQQQLRLRGGQGNGQLIVQATVKVAEHLVFIHHQQSGAVPPDQTVLLRLQRGHHDWRA